MFIGVNAGMQKKGSMNPEKALVRFEFLEILLRSALKKYCESGELESEVEALGAFWDDYLEPHQHTVATSDNPYFYD